MKDLLIVYIISFLATIAAISQSNTIDQQISSDATSIDRFGAVIEISNTYAIVGASQATSAAIPGASYIIGEQQNKMVPGVRSIKCSLTHSYRILNLLVVYQLKATYCC